MDYIAPRSDWYTFDMTTSLQKCTILLFQFFNDSLVLGKETDSCMERHIYELILELNRISNTILLSVLPQLEFKLKVSWHGHQSML